MNRCLRAISIACEIFGRFIRFEIEKKNFHSHNQFRIYIQMALISLHLTTMVAVATIGLRRSFVANRTFINKSYTQFFSARLGCERINNIVFNYCNWMRRYALDWKTCRKIVHHRYLCARYKLVLILFTVRCKHIFPTAPVTPSSASLFSLFTCASFIVCIWDLFEVAKLRMNVGVNKLSRIFRMTIILMFRTQLIDCAFSRQMQ